MSRSSQSKRDIDQHNMLQSNKRAKHDNPSAGHGDDQSIDKPPTPSLFPYSFMSCLVIVYLDDQDVILSLLLVNKAMKPHLTGYRLKAPIEQNIILELSCKTDRYLNIVPTQVGDVTDLASLTRFTSVTSIQLNEIYTDIILPGTLPQSITELDLGYKFNQPITHHMLPAQLKKLTLSDEFDHAIPSGVLPDSLEHLDLGLYFNQPLVPGSLPASLTTLKLSSSSDHNLSPGILPASLLDLHLGMIFNQRLEPGDLPSSITHLHMGMYFNHELSPGVLPASLIKLELSKMFNKPLVRGCFPDTLHSLAFGDEFNHSIASGILPLGLKRLALSNKFNKSLDGMLMSELVKLNGYSPGRVIFSKDADDLAYAQSRKITDVVIPGKLLQPDSIPSSATRLKLRGAVAPGIIPSSITHLVWDTEDALDVGVVPNSVTHLIFGEYFNRPVPPSAIPPSVTHLAFGARFAQQIRPSFIPDSVRCKLVTRPPCVVSHSLQSMMRGPLDIPDSFFEEYNEY